MPELKPTIKISELVRRLNAIKRAKGDLLMAMSSDTEGNGYSTLDRKHSFVLDGNVLILWPFYEHDDLDLIAGYSQEKPDIE